MSPGAHDTRYDLPAIFVVEVWSLAATLVCIAVAGLILVGCGVGR